MIECFWICKEDHVSKYPGFKLNAAYIATLDRNLLDVVSYPSLVLSRYDNIVSFTLIPLDRCRLFIEEAVTTITIPN